MRFSTGGLNRFAITHGKSALDTGQFAFGRVVVYDLPALQGIDTFYARLPYYAFSTDGQQLIVPYRVGQFLALNFWQYGVWVGGIDDSIVASALIGKSRLVYDIAVSEDGSDIYVAGAFGLTIVDMTMVNPAVDDTLRLWRVQLGDTIPGLAWDVDVDPTGRRVASMDHENGLTVWDLSSKEILWQERLDSSSMAPIEWSPNGERVLTCTFHQKSSEYLLEEYDADDGKLIRTLDVTAFHGVAHPYYALGGEYIIGACGDTALRVWDAETLELVDEIRDHAAPFSVDVSHDGRSVVTVGLDSLLHLYEFAASAVSESVAGESTTVLHQPYPNPSCDEVEIGFSLSRGGEVELSIVDLHGRVVVDLSAYPASAGHHGRRIDVGDLPSGMYYVVMRVGGERFVRSMKVVR